MRRVALFLALTLASVGCIAASTEPPAQPVAEEIPGFLALDHDHEDPKLHQGAKGLSLAGYAPICGKEAPCSFGELDVWGDLAIVAIVDPHGGFALVDVADPTAPKLLSKTSFGSVFATDVKLAPDGRTAFVGVSNYLPFQGRAGLVAQPTSVLGMARGQGIYAYDVADPSAPREVAFHPIGADGVHMLDVHVIDGEMIVFASLPAYFKFAAPSQARDVVEKITILRYDGAAFERLSEYAPPDVPSGDAAHDMTVVDDPVEGPILLGGYGFGVGVASVRDPAAPKHLGSWSIASEGIEGYRNAHTVMMTYVEGRRVIVTACEQAEDNEMFLVDAHDLGAMSLVGRWHLPGDLGDYRGLEWSMHNHNILDGKIYLAHYHGGVWALDINSTADLARPPVLGYFAPTERGNVGPGLAELWTGPTAPNVWDVVPGKGVVFVSDITSGFYVLDAEWAIPDALPYGTRGA